VGVVTFDRVSMISASRLMAVRAGETPDFT